MTLRSRLDSIDWRFLTTSRQMVVDSFPAILVFLGVVLILLGAYIPNESKMPTVMNTVGVTILSSGVFSAIVNSRYFLRVYSRTLEDIIYGRDFLSKRSDLDQIWRRVSDALCEKRFPDLKDQIDNAVLENYIPKTRNFYYSNVDRTFRVTGISSDGRTLECEDTFHSTIKPHEGVDSITYEYKFKPSIGGSGDIDEITVDGKPWNQLEGSTSKSEALPGGLVARKLTLTASKHVIRRRRTSTIPLSPEPYSKATYSTYVQKLRLHARCDGDLPICVRLVDNELFAPINVDAEEEGRVAVENSRLLMPGEGHMLLFVKIETTQPPEG